MKNPKLDMSTHSKRKPFFEEMGVCIINDDVCKSELFAGEFIDLIVTSPPYNVGIDYDSNDDTLSYRGLPRF